MVFGALVTTPAFCSWSGGKDSSLALARARAAGLEPDALLTMLTEDGSRTRSHGLRVEIVEEQAAALGLRLVTRSAPWAGYEAAFAGALRELRGDGIVAGIFGDIDVEEHRGWVVRMCASAGIEPALPLWQEERRALLHELIANETEAQVVAVRDGLVPPRLLGRALDRTLVSELETLGVDPCGEGGEYHTVVVNAPDFARRLDLRRGTASLRDGVWFLDLHIKPTRGLMWNAPRAWMGASALRIAAASIGTKDLQPCHRSTRPRSLAYALPRHTPIPHQASRLGRVPTCRTAVILTIGNEIVSGEIENTNGSWLARRCAELGLEVRLLAALRDDVHAVGTFLSGSGGYDVVLVTGGLGGTPDDITREAVAAAFGVECVEIPELAHRLRERFARKGLSDYAARWALIPAGAEPIENPLGGAPGFALRNVIVMPGLPSEMEAMFESVAGRFHGDPIGAWKCSYRTGEGQIVAVLEEATRRHPLVTVGSYPRFLDDGPETDVVLRSADADALSVAVAWVETALESVLRPARP